MQNDIKHTNTLLNSVYDIDTNSIKVKLDGFDNTTTDYNDSVLTGKEYVDPVRLSTEITETLPSVQVYDAAWSLYSTTGFSFVHSILNLGDYIYASTRSFPARLGKFNKNDFTDNSIITFPGSDTSSLYSNAETLIYSDYKKKLYIPFGNVSGDARQLKIAEINTDTLDYNLIIEMTGTTYKPGYPKGIAINNKLYVIITGDYKLLEFSLDTYELLREYSIPVTSTETCSSIDSDGSYIYIAELYGDAKVKKIDLETLTMVDSVSIDTKSMSSNSCLFGDYFWVTSITSYDSVLNKGFYKINKNDLSDVTHIYLEDIEDSWGMINANGYVWASIKKSPGELLRINTETLEINRLSLNVGENDVNKIVGDGQNLYMNTFSDPTIFIKINNPEFFDETYYAGSDNDVLMKISNIDKEVEIKEAKIGDIINENYQHIEPDGTQQSIGDAKVWDDLVGSLVASRLESTAGKLNYNFDNNTITMQSGGNPLNIADRLIFNFQYLHKAIQSTSAETLAYQYIHIHWEQENTNQIEWQLDYRVQRNGQEKVTGWTSVTSNSTDDSVFDYSTGTTINQITNLGIIPVEFPSLSATVQYRLTRTDTTGLDIEALFVDAHILIDMDGSRTQWTK